MNRIENKFSELKQIEKKAFVPYVCAGDPSLRDTVDIVLALEEAGASVIELGVPFSDPLADGPVIQAASIRSIDAGFTVKGFFNTVKEIRKKSEIPLVAMVYYSTIFGFGTQKFIDLCVESGIDGIIVPDLPYEEYDEIMPYIEKTDICLIPLIAITSKDRIPMLVEKTRGFIYCVSSLGVTGERAAFDTRVNDFVKTVKNATNTPVCVGFGISKKEDVKRFDGIADGVIVGSAIVRKIFDTAVDLEKLKKFIKELTQ